MLEVEWVFNFKARKNHTFLHAFMTTEYCSKQNLYFYVHVKA